MVVTAKLPQPAMRQSKMERTTSTNVAVNGVSMPTSDGKLHRHGPLLKNQSPSKHRRSSPHHHRHGRSSSRGRAEATGTRSRSSGEATSPITTPSKRSKSQAQQQQISSNRSGAGTLDAFMQQRLEHNKPVSLKSLGVALLLQPRDEDRNDDGLTHVAVSHEEPPASENDQSIGNVKKAKKQSGRNKEMRRSDRLEHALTQVKAVKDHDKVSAAVTKKAKALTVVTEKREQNKLRVDEALRLFEQKYKLSAPDADVTSQEAQDGYVSTSIKPSERKKMIAPMDKGPTAAAQTPSMNVVISSTTAGNLLPTTEPARHGTGAVIQASSSLSSNNNGTTTILHCIGSGDDQRSTSASTTIRRLERKGRRYKEVITVVSKSDESNVVGSTGPATVHGEPPGSVGPTEPALNTRIIIEDLTKPKVTKPMTLSEKLDRAKGSHSSKKDSAEYSPSRKAEPSFRAEKRSTDQPLLLKEAKRASKAPTTDSAAETNVTEPNAPAGATTVEDLLGGRQSPTYRAVLSNYQDTPSRSSAKGGWLGFGKIISPRWFPRRASAGTPLSQEIHAGKVTPLIALTHRLQKSSDVEVKSTKKLPMETESQQVIKPQVGMLCATETGACFQDDDGVMRQKEDDHNDDDASSLFNFHSANSSDKELGDIFSFISGRRGSRDVHDERKSFILAAAGRGPEPTENKSQRESESRPSIAARAADPTVAVAPLKPTEVPKIKSVFVDSETQSAGPTDLNQDKKTPGLRVVTARTRKDHFLSFLKSRNRPSESKEGAGKVGIKSALRPLLRKDASKKVVPEGSLKKETASSTNEADETCTSTRIPAKVDVGAPAPAVDPPKPGKSPAVDETAQLPSDPLSPIGAISQDLTQSTSMESNSTGGMFGIGTFLNTMCGPDKKCEVGQPLAWRECGQADDDHSVIDDETKVKHKQLVEIAPMPPFTKAEAAADSSIVDGCEELETMRNAAPTSPKHADGIDAIETVLHNHKKHEPVDRLSPMRRVLSTGNLSVANGALFNVRVSLRYLKGLAALVNKSHPSHAMNRSVVVGFVRVGTCSSLASRSLDVARSRPVNLISLSDKGGPLPPVVWSSKRVLDRRRGGLYFSVVLKQHPSGGEYAYFPERIRLVFGLQRGEDTIELGSAAFDIDGTEKTQTRLDLPLQAETDAGKKTPFLGPLRKTSNHNSFVGDKHDFFLLPDSVLSTRIDVKAGDHDMAGPLVWEDYIVGDDESFDDSRTPSLSEEQSPAEPYESVEVVPLPRGAAILAKSSYLDGFAGISGRDSPANESMSSLQKKDSRGFDNHRRRIPYFFGRKKSIKAAPALPVIAATKSAEPVDRARKIEPVVVNDPPEDEGTASFLSPISESHSDCSFSALPSNDDESSDGASSSVSSKKRGTLTDKAADWVYRGARAAGFFSYSSDEEKMTQFSFGTKDDTQNYPTSDLSDSVMTDEASEIVVEQLKYWIASQTTTSYADEPPQGEASTLRTSAASRTSLTEILRSKGDEQETNPQKSLEHFKKILLLAQRLNLSPYDLIRRLENGENIEALLHSK